MKESAKTADIYQHAVLTLSATSSADVYSGIFSGLEDGARLGHLDHEDEELCIQRPYNGTHKAIFWA